MEQIVHQGKSKAEAKDAASPPTKTEKTEEKPSTAPTASSDGKERKEVRGSQPGEAIGVHPIARCA